MGDALAARAFTKMWPAGRSPSNVGPFVTARLRDAACHQRPVRQ